LLESCKRGWARFLLAVSFVRVSVQGRENLDGSRTCIFCANHLSYLDPPLLLACLETPVRFLAKKSLFGIPFLGWAMRGEGDVPIDRENPRAAARSLARAAALVRQGTSLVVFPEGGRSRDGTLQPFLSGAFRIAIRSQTPVVPIAIRGTREALRPGSLHFRGGHVQVAIGKPISTHELSAADQDTLSIAVREKIQPMLEDFSPRPASSDGS
jgi:1-acyl-sn-glycerol-3-phosphate acyltransferase